jgi:hypothetical protein
MMKSSSQYAYAKSVTEDSNSNDTSFSSDDDDDSNEVDKVFQDHNFSLSQVAVNDNVDGEDFEEDEDDEDDGHQEEGTADPSYDDPAMDSELANNWETLQQTASRKKKKTKRQKSMKEYSRDESPGRCRLSYGTSFKDNDGSVYLKGRLGGQRGDRLFKPGETFLSAKKEYDGMAFTLGNMDCFDGDMIWKAECTAVWMRVEKTFISDAAADIEQEWVLLKKHKLLASKKGWQLPSIPAATHGPGLLPKRTAKDAIGDLEKTEPTETGRVLLDGSKEIYDHYRQGTELGTKLDKKTVLDANEAAGTIRKQNPIMHYLKHRYITARERSR